MNFSFLKGVEEGKVIRQDGRSTSFTKTGRERRFQVLKLDVTRDTEEQEPQFRNGEHVIYNNTHTYVRTHSLITKKVSRKFEIV